MSLNPVRGAPSCPIALRQGGRAEPVGLRVSARSVTQEKFDGFGYMVSRKRGASGALLGKDALNGARSAIVDLHKAQLVFYKSKLKDDAKLIYDQVRSHCHHAAGWVETYACGKGHYGLP